MTPGNSEPHNGVNSTQADSVVSADSEYIGYLSELMILDGKETPTPRGWTKLDQDLNEGAGGAFLYLCYRRRESGEPFINDIVVWRSLRDPTAPAGYKVVCDQSGKPVDLNRGAGGQYLFMSYQLKDSSNLLGGIINMRIVVRNSEGGKAPLGWVRVPNDLNAGARGRYIYLEFKRSS